MSEERFFLKTDWTSWQEVTKEQWVKAERNAGFINTMNKPDELATGGFNARGISGMIISSSTKPEDYSWNPIFRKAVWPQEHCYECGEFVDEGTGEHHGRAGAVHNKCLYAVEYGVFH